MLEASTKTESTFTSKALKWVAALITGVTHGMVSMGLAWACFSFGMFSPVGIVFMVAAIVNFIVNTIFYSRDTLRITTWMNPTTARSVWPEVFDNQGVGFIKKAVIGFKKFWTLLAGFIGLAEIEAQLRIKDFSQRMVHLGLNEGAYKALYNRLAELDKAFIQLDPDFYALFQHAAHGNNLYAEHRLVDYALQHEVYRLRVFRVEIANADIDVPQVISDHYRAYRTAMISANPGAAASLPVAFDPNLIGCRLWLQDHFAALQKDPHRIDERNELLAHLVEERRGNPSDALWWPVRLRQSLTSFFFFLSLMLSGGMALLLMRGLESFFFKLGMSAAMFTPLGFTLVAICFFCILFQLYVTLNEFWVDAYWHEGFSWNRLLNRFKSWLTGDHLTPDGGWIHNPNRRSHIVKRLFTGMFFIGVIAMALVATWGFYQSFTLSLEKVFSGTHALVQLSGRVYHAVYWLLTVSALARLSMALVMMARGFWATLSGLAWFFGRYLNARVRHAWAHLISHNKEAQVKYQAEVEGHREKASVIFYNIFMSSVLSPINTVANMNWVTSGHGMPVPLMMAAAAVQSQLLISKNGRWLFKVNRFSLISLYFDAYVQTDSDIVRLLNDHGGPRFNDVIEQLSTKPRSREALWHRACVLALFVAGKIPALSPDQIRMLWGDSSVSECADIANIIPGCTLLNQAAGDSISAEAFKELADAIYVELAFNTLPRLRMVHTWNRLRRLWRQGLVNWLAKGLGVGGALWFLNAMLDHHGVFAGLAPAIGVLVPVLVFVSSLALVFLASESLSAVEGDKNQVSLGDWLNKFAKTFGSAGVAWALVSIFNVLGFVVPFLGVGAVALAFVMGTLNLTYGWDARFAELSHVWYKVLGSGAAVWFLGSAIATCLTAAGIAFSVTNFHIVLASLVLACVLYAAYDVYCDYAQGKYEISHLAKLTHDETDGMSERPTPQLNSNAAGLRRHDDKAKVVNAFGFRFFDRARLQLEEQSNHKGAVAVNHSVSK